MLQSKMVYFTDAITVKIFCLKSKLFSLVIPAALKSSIKKFPYTSNIEFKSEGTTYIYIPCYLILLRQINLNQKGFNPHLQV